MPVIRARYGARGPIIDAHIGPSEPLRNLMRARGIHIPPPINVQLLIDTGADTTTIAEIHMRSLGLTPSGAAPVRTITTGVTGAACNTYDTSLRIDSHLFGDRPHEIPALEVLAQELHNEGIDGLLGRDVLSTLLTTIDGPRRTFILQWA